MFKRVEKRIKREEDRVLDMDYEALGLNETDSDDSQESDVFDQQDEDESEEWGGLGYEDSDVGEGYEHMEDDNVDEQDTSEEELGDVDKKRQVSFHAFTVDEALKEPIYKHPSQSNASLCALCPGKMLIAPLTISQHQESKAHTRRSKRISELARLPENKDRDFSDLLKEMSGGKPQVESQGESKRAEKKRKAAEIRKAKREKRKEQEKAKKEKQKQDADEKEADERRPTKPDNVSLSDAKKQKDGKHKVKFAKTTSTTKGLEDKQAKKSGGEMPRPSASDITDQANKRKRKPEREKEKEQEQEPAEKAQAPPSKKRKTGADNAASSSEKIDITQQIKNIAKSASKRAHQALDKANKGGSGGVLETKGGKKKSG